jgi:hypothetical protein
MYITLHYKRYTSRNSSVVGHEYKSSIAANAATLFYRTNRIAQKLKSVPRDGKQRSDRGYSNLPSAGVCVF